MFPLNSPKEKAKFTVIIILRAEVRGLTDRVEVVDINDLKRNAMLMERVNHFHYAIIGSADKCKVVYDESISGDKGMSDQIADVRTAFPCKLTLTESARNRDIEFIGILSLFFKRSGRCGDTHDYFTPRDPGLSFAQTH